MRSKTSRPSEHMISMERASSATAPVKGLGEQRQKREVEDAALFKQFILQKGKGLKGTEGSCP